MRDINRNGSEKKKTKECGECKRPREHGKANFSIGDDSYKYSKILAATNEKTMKGNTEDKEVYVIDSYDSS